MKYIFIDTNIFIASAISTQSEHKIDSFSQIFELVKKKKIELIIPEYLRLSR